MPPETITCICGVEATTSARKLSAWVCCNARCPLYQVPIEKSEAREQYRIFENTVLTAASGKYEHREFFEGPNRPSAQLLDDVQVAFLCAALSGDTDSGMRWADRISTLRHQREA